MVEVRKRGIDLPHTDRLTAVRFKKKLSGENGDFGLSMQNVLLGLH